MFSVWAKGPDRTGAHWREAVGSTIIWYNVSHALTNMITLLTHAVIIHAMDNSQNKSKSHTQTTIYTQLSLLFLILFLFYNIVQRIHLYNNSHINKQVFDFRLQLNLNAGNMLIVRNLREPCWDFVCVSTCTCLGTNVLFEWALHHFSTSC